LEPNARFSARLALLSTCALLALGGAGCGSSDKISSVPDPTGAATPRPTTKFSAAGGFASVGGKGGKGHKGNGDNGNGNRGGGGGGDGGGNGNGNDGGGHHRSGNGRNDNSTASGLTDGNPKTSSKPGNVAGAVDCKSNDNGAPGNSSECASTINCTNVHLPGTDCCPFPLPSDEGGHKRKSSDGNCPTAESDQTESKSDQTESKSGKGGRKHKGS
jgi:hypothetical protein